MTKVSEFNCTTGEATVRDMTDAEEAEYAQMVSDAADKKAVEDAAEAKQAADKTSGEAKLADLGLTADEIAALVG
jgi:hypothetical protein